MWLAVVIAVAPPALAVIAWIDGRLDGEVVASYFALFAGTAGIINVFPTVSRNRPLRSSELPALAAWVAVLFAGIVAHPATPPGVDASALCATLQLLFFGGGLPCIAVGLYQCAQRRMPRLDGSSPPESESER